MMAAQQYGKTQTPLIVIAGRDYGAGSSRDWAAKGPYLLGVRAVIAQSFERIHRSNLIGMGIVPLQWCDKNNVPTLLGSELFDIRWNGQVAGEANTYRPRKRQEQQQLSFALSH